MCGYVSPKVKQLTGERVFWKVVDRGVEGLHSGPCIGIPITVGRWRKAERLSQEARYEFERKPEGNFYGFNVFRTRKQAEAYVPVMGGQVARVVAKGGYRNATTDKQDGGISCLLVEWIKILEVFE